MVMPLDERGKGVWRETVKQVEEPSSIYPNIIPVTVFSLVIARLPT